MSEYLVTYNIGASGQIQVEANSNEEAVNLAYAQLGCDDFDSIYNIDLDAELVKDE